MNDYTELREKIHYILQDFYDTEIECYKDEEFDFEFFEYVTDNILRLIREQGGGKTYE